MIPICPKDMLAQHQTSLVVDREMGVHTTFHHPTVPRGACGLDFFCHGKRGNRGVHGRRDDK